MNLSTDLCYEIFYPIFYLGGHHEVKIQQGPGAAAGSTPTDLDQSTGLERAELLGKMQGKDIFDLAPLEVHVRGTKANPTIIHSRDPIRYVGCAGTLLV